MPTADSAWLDAAGVATRDRRRTLIADRLRTLRQARGMSQDALAQAAGLSRTMVVHVEAGDRSMLVDRLWNLCDALGVTVGEFMDPLESGRRDRRKH